MNLRSLNVWRNRDGGSRSVILHLALAVGLVVAACTPGEESSTTTSRQANTMSGSSTTTISSEACSDSVDFEDVSLGTMFSSGDGFVTGGVDVAVDDFVWDDGTLFGGGEAEVVASGLAGGSGNEVFTNNVLLRFGFPSSPLDGLSFDFGAHGGNLNIEINGDFVNFDSFGDIDGTTIGGVTVSVLSISGATGSLELAGTISDVAVGGQEFAIDNICGALDGELGVGNLL